MKILITGSKGLVGSSLIPKLQQEHEVIAFDRVYDVSVDREWPQADLIINLAALNSTKESIENPRRYFEVNAFGNLNMLEAARKMGAKYLYLTTVKEFEHHPYGASKATASIWCGTYRKTYNMPIVVNQVGNLYGPNGDNFWVNIFMQKSKSGETIEVWGDGSASRDMLYVDDLTDLIVDQANNFDTYAKHDLIPVGGGKDNVLSVKALLDWLKYDRVVYKDAIQTLDTGRVVDNRMVAGIRGWTPKTSLEEGLRKTYESIA